MEPRFWYSVYWLCPGVSECDDFTAPGTSPAQLPAFLLDTWGSEFAHCLQKAVSERQGWVGEGCDLALQVGSEGRSAVLRCHPSLQAIVLCIFFLDPHAAHKVAPDTVPTLQVRKQASPRLQAPVL